MKGKKKGWTPLLQLSWVPKENRRTRCEVRATIAWVSTPSRCRNQNLSSISKVSTFRDSRPEISAPFQRSGGLIKNLGHGACFLGHESQLGASNPSAVLSQWCCTWPSPLTETRREKVVVAPLFCHYYAPNPVDMCWSQFDNQLGN